MPNNFQWESRPLVRPNRYQDWSEQVKRGALISQSPPPENRWVYVAIEVNDGDSFLDNLKWLAKQLTKGLNAAPAITMAQSEKTGLHTQIDALSAPPLRQVDNTRFDVSMRISDIIENGNYRKFDQFTIIYSAPFIAVDEQLIDAEISFTSIKSINQTVAAPVLERVAIGIIDDGIGFANCRFRKTTADNNPDTSRFEHLWIQDFRSADQAGIDADAAPIAFGTKLTRADINILLNDHTDANGMVDENAIYRKTGLDFAHEEKTTLGRKAAHGTHVLDLAAGYEAHNANDDRPILGVQLPTIVTGDTSGQTLASFALQGLKQIFAWADTLPASQQAGTSNNGLIPLVINFSYGYQAGPKDGTSFIEREIERLITNRRARGGITFVVMPAGNSYGDRTNAKLTMMPNQAEQIDWIVQPDDHTENFIEIWLPLGTYAAATPPLKVMLNSPADALNTHIITPEPNTHVSVLTANGKPIAGAYFDLGDPTDQAQTRPRLLLAVNRTTTRDSILQDIVSAPSGRWTITLENTSGHELIVDINVQRDDTLSGYRLGARQSYLDHDTAHNRSSKTGTYSTVATNSPVTGEATLSAMVGNKSTLIIGAADNGAILPAHDHINANAVFKTAIQPSPYSASGPIPGRSKPTGSAIIDQGTAYPGTYATGIQSGSTNIMDGTSAAAPIFCRALSDFIIAAQGRFNVNNVHVHDDILGLLQCEHTLITVDNERLGDFTVNIQSATSHFVENRRRYG